MNENFHQIVNRWVSAILTVCTILPVNFTIPVLAEGESVSDNESNLKWCLNEEIRYSKRSYNTTYPLTRMRMATTAYLSNDNLSSYIVTTETIPVYAFNYKRKSSNYWHTVWFYYSDTKFNNLALYFDFTNDRLQWTYASATSANVSSYTFSGTNPNTGANAQGQKIYYLDCEAANSGSNPCNSTSYSYYIGDYMPDECPRIIIEDNQNVSTILAVYSMGDYDYLPWTFSTTTGGLHFEDGTELDSNNTTTYSTVYNTMDINNDNSISEEEVNYYNVTNNTNYDYSTINEGNDFTEMQFLAWVANQINNGNDNPGGGSGDSGNPGTGSGASAISGGVTIGEGSFTQSQTQTQSIAENAVSVTVNNNNELSQENSQYLNNVINNNLGTEGNSFEQAIGTISGFTNIARSFATLAGTVLGFLPSWVLSLLAITISLLLVMIVFRLIHLFV